MSSIRIHKEKITKRTDRASLAELCPFGSIQVSEKDLFIDESCRLCRLCEKNGPAGLFEFIEGDTFSADLSEYRGIAVFIEVEAGKIHPVSLELVGKGKELADKAGEPLLAVVPGFRLEEVTRELRRFGIDRIYVYDQKELTAFRIEPYTAVLEDFIKEVKPSVFLAGGTTVGRNLAPRTAARCRTGLTADCTILDIDEEGGLIQIRPAFGGNIMARIKTPNHRPQFATVRYKIFSAPRPGAQPAGEVVGRKVSHELLKSTIEVLDVSHKEKVKHLEEAEVIIAAGRGIGKEENLKLLYRLAELLDGEVAGTRPLIEAGWIDPRRQIGLSGRTVRPKLIITCGISGSVQFVAGMKGSDRIISINTDREAPIFRTAHTAIAGDVLEILPALIDRLEKKRKETQEALHV